MGFAQDLRFAVRLLWKHKTFTTTVLLTLALCIGGNVTIFSVVYSVLLRPLPVPESDRIQLVYNIYPAATGSGASARGSNSVPHYLDRVRELDDVFVEQALYQGNGFTVGRDGSPEQVFGWGVTPSFFRLVQVPPQLGRIFTEEEGEIGAEQKVMLSDALWQRLYDGDPAVVGAQMRINSQSYEIVGVMPADFAFEDADVQLWTPLAFTEEQRSDNARHRNSWQMLGRLKPDVTSAHAQARLDQLTAAEGDRFPDFRQLLIDAGFRTVTFPLQDVLVRDIRGTLYLLWGGVVFVLLIGGVNVANLILIRSSARLNELGMRHALGAGRGRLARQLLTESVLLTLVGGALGLVVGAGGLQLLGVLGADELPRGGEIAMDGLVATLTLVAAAVFGLLLGLVPVVSLAATNLQTLLRRESRGGTTGRGVKVFRHLLVVSQIAIAFVLLIGATLMLVSFQRILAIDTGFRTDHMLTAQVSLPRARYAESDDRLAFSRRALDTIQNLPGVLDVGLTSSVPFGISQNNSVIGAVGYDPQPGESLISPSSITVDSHYLQTLGIPLREGRYFDDRDTPESMRAIIIDETLANRFWPEGGAVGGQMYQDVEMDDDTTLLTVVGVVAEHTLAGLVDVPEQIGAYFFPDTQRPLRSPTFAIRTEGDPHALVNSVRAAVATIDPELPLFFVQTMEERIGERLTSRRTPMLLALGFAAVAVFLSAIGIYGVLAYRVTQRTREFGIRMALGSSTSGLFRLVLSEGAVVLVLGLALGVAGAFVVRDVVASQLYGTEPTDPLVMLGVVGLLSLVALAASVIPARRATEVDPVIALNYE